MALLLRGLLAVPPVPCGARQAAPGLALLHKRVWLAPFSTASRWNNDGGRHDSPSGPGRKKEEDIAAVYESLPSTQQKSRFQLTKRFSSFMDKAQTSIFFAGQRINDLTGYSGIEALKSEIAKLEQLTRTTRESVSEAKAVYSAAITRRSSSQREINDLLQRQSSWTPQDLERFTALYRSDHANQQAEIAAEATLLEAERVAEDAQGKLSKTILARYHEEQIWSDKIRRVSTWGTWGLMGLNFLLFLVFQIGVEPWRRARLVRGFDEKVKEALREVGLIAEKDRPVGSALAAAAEDSTPDSAATGSVSDSADPSVESPLVDAESEEGYDEFSELSVLDGFTHTLDVLFAETPITISHYELTTSILSGFFMGTLLTTAVALVFILGMDAEL